MINVDTVYQRVLALVNKEQRGYLTPLEFNLLANQAQLDIFEQYFYDLNQFDAVGDTVDVEIADTVEWTQEKMSIFKNDHISITSNTLPADLYRLINIIKNEIIIEEVTREELHRCWHSKLTQPTPLTPLYVRDRNTFQAWENTSGLMTQPFNITYIRKPKKVEWGYNVVIGKALYNSSTSKHFELHASEESKLVTIILELAGITIYKPGLVTLADSMKAAKLQQQKA